MSAPLTAAFVALLAWWFSTGAILLAVRRADRAGRGAFGRAVLWGLPFLAFGITAVAVSVQALTLLNLYLGFFGTLAIWGWIELTFLSGTITGPRRVPLRRNACGMDRFVQAWSVVAYHEGLLLVGFLGLLYLSLGTANPLAVWVYGILLGARVLAKLNLFHGVPGINIDAVPSPLSHIPSYFRKSDPSWVFPLSITVLTLLTALWVERLTGATTPESAVMFAFMSALTALALIEHWMMLLPLADTKLWRWMMPDKPQTAETAK